MALINTNLIRTGVDKRRDSIIMWLESLIRFPSENRPPFGHEDKIQKFILQESENEGWEVDHFFPEDIPEIEKHPSWLEGRDYDNDRENVVARWRGSGGGKSILLTGHSDVAPFEPGDWKVTRPFEPLLKDGRLYGRGSADMKGGLTASFWAMKLLKEEGFMPRGDIIFESIVDEEFAGGNGTLASRLRGYNADLALLTEPTGMKAAPACLGAFLGDIIVKGKGGMPFTGYEIPNPLEGTARIIQLFSQWKSMWNEKNEHPLFTGNNRRLDLVLWNVEVKEKNEFTQMGTPLVAKLSWIVWGYPGLTVEEFYREFRGFWDPYFRSDDILKAFEITIAPTFHYVKPWETDPEGPEMKAVIDAYSAYSGVPPEVAGAPFSCDMAIYGEAGNPVIIFGPRGDNLHAPDEWVLIEDIYSLTGIIAQLIVNWCS